MRLKHIEVFYAAYTTGTVSKAAKMLGVSQPSVSKVLRHAEDQLGFLLFERTPSGLIPTANGERLFLEIEPLHHNLESVRRVAGNLGREKGGSIRIGMLPSLATSFLPRAIAEYRRKYPDVMFDLQTRQSDLIIPSLLEGENEIGITIEPPKHPAMREVEIGHGEFVAIFPANTELPPSQRVDLGVFADRSFIEVTDTGPPGDRLARRLEEMEIHPKTCAITRTYYLARELVQQGVGAAIIDEMTAQAGCDRSLPIKYFSPPLEFSIKCLYLADRPLSDIARSFLKFLGDRFPEYRKPRPPLARKKTG